jgi:hypothetical protein
MALQGFLFAKAGIAQVSILLLNHPQFNILSALALTVGKLVMPVRFFHGSPLL